MVEDGINGFCMALAVGTLSVPDKPGSTEAYYFYPLTGRRAKA